MSAILDELRIHRPLGRGSSTKDDYSNIDTLVEKNIINAKLGGRLKEANGLKNRIVHDYNGLDDSIAYERILALIVVFKDYKNGVNKWLAKNF